MESETNTEEVSCLSIGCPGQCYRPRADDPPTPQSSRCRARHCIPPDRALPCERRGRYDREDLARRCSRPCVCSVRDLLGNVSAVPRITDAMLCQCRSRPTTEIEPQLTLRGHSAAITRLVHSPSKQLLYSASLDSSIRIWALPPSSHTTYAPYDATRARGELIGHTDAVWDLALVRDESTLISCGAEGAVKVWDVSGPSGGGSLKLSWLFDGLDASEPQNEGDAPGATAVEAIKTDLKKVAVAYQNAGIKIFEIETGKELVRLQTEPSEGGCGRRDRRVERAADNRGRCRGHLVAGKQHRVPSHDAPADHRAPGQTYPHLRHPDW